MDTFTININKIHNMNIHTDPSSSADMKSNYIHAVSRAATSCLRLLLCSSLLLCRLYVYIPRTSLHHIKNHPFGWFLSVLRIRNKIYKHKYFSCPNLFSVYNGLSIYSKEYNYDCIMIGFLFLPIYI